MTEGAPTRLHQEITKIPDALPLTAQTKVGTEFASILTTSETLTKNLIAEAVLQGIPEDVARRHASNTTFSLAHQLDFYNTLAQQEPDTWRSLKYRARAINPVGFYGMVQTQKDGTNALGISVEAIGQHIAEKYSQYPLEVQQAAFTQMLNVVWRHESQHLIQDMNPATKEAYKRHHTANKLISATLYGANFVIGQCLSADSQQVERNIIQGVVGALFVASVVYPYVGSPSEKDARATAAHTDKKSPFQVTFEK